MKLTWEPITLNLKTTFRIAHGASDQRYNVLVHIGDGTEAGVGEAAGVHYHGETQAGIIEYLGQIAGRDLEPFLMEDSLRDLPPGSRGARAGVDIALHDLLGKRLGQPLYRILGLDPAKAPLTSFTVSMDEPAVMAQRARASGLPVIKIKLGSPDDQAIVAAVREANPDCRLYVDANTAWSREQAAGLIPRLAEYGLEFIEQPLAIGDIEGLRWLRQQKLGALIFADENIKTAQDVAAHTGAVDGVVIKLAKSCGLREALRAIHTARALDMQVMIGCMVESSVAVTAAAHISPLCDYADLDGPLLVANDPYRGVQYQDGRMILPDLPGLGVVRA
ncbi:MAG: dipeptide epimerase [Anaerolineales bacterium]|nr:dipeptide epimerase [Anaerolineales bacterium]